MHKLRIKAIIRKYKLSGVAAFSVIGLTSAFAVNVGGFLILLPKPFWPLVDSSFVSSYFIRFSILLALAFFAARYASYVISQSVGVVWANIIALSLFASRAGLRLLRRRGNEAVVSMDRSISRSLDNQKNTQDSQNTAAQMSIQRFYSSETVKRILGVYSITSYIRGKFNYRLEYYSIPLQILALIVVLSALFTTLLGSVLLIGAGLLLVIFLRPSFLSVYLEKLYFEHNISPLAFLKYENRHLFSFQKITLLVLTLSFMSGILHHMSLLSETKKLRFFGDIEITGTLIFASTSGFVIHNGLKGYQFIPVEGTHIEALPSSYRTNR